MPPKQMPMGKPMTAEEMRRQMEDMRRQNQEQKRGSGGTGKKGKK